MAASACSRRAREARRIPRSRQARLAEASAQLQADSITAIAAADERFSTLVAAVTAAGLAETLAGPGPFTVFAPVNDAFAALPAGTVETLLKPENKGQLTDILLYHVDDRNLPAAAIPAGSNYFKPMLTSQRLCITAGADGVTIADGTGVGTIRDDGTPIGGFSDDDRPTLSVSDVSVTEGTDNFAVFIFFNGWFHK